MIERYYIAIGLLILFLTAKAHERYDVIHVFALNKTINSGRLGLNYNLTCGYYFNVGSEIQFDKKLHVALNTGIGILWYVHFLYSVTIDGEHAIRTEVSFRPKLYLEPLKKNPKNSRMYNLLKNIELDLFFDKGLWSSKNKNYLGISLGYIIAN